VTDLFTKLLFWTLVVAAIVTPIGLMLGWS